MRQEITKDFMVLIEEARLIIEDSSEFINADDYVYFANCCNDVLRSGADIRLCKAWLKEQKRRRVLDRGMHKADIGDRVLNELERIALLIAICEEIGG